MSSSSHSGGAVYLVIFSLHHTGASSVLGAIGFITTVSYTRGPSITMHKGLRDQQKMTGQARELLRH